MSEEKKHALAEAEIWENFKKGSEKAFDYIYDKYFTVLYGYGSHICSNRALVKDCIQNLFVELWKNKENLSEVRSIKYYLYKSIRRKILNELEKENKHKLHDLSNDYDFEVTVSHEFNIIDEQIMNEKKDQLLKSFETLSKRQKEAIFLRFYENMEYQDIASIMSLKEVKYARTLIYRAIEVLKYSFSNQMVDND